MCRGQTNRTSEGGEKCIRGSSIWNGGAWGSNPSPSASNNVAKVSVGEVSMESLISDLVSHFEKGSLNRRDLGSRLN